MSNKSNRRRYEGEKFPHKEEPNFKRICPEMPCDIHVKIMIKLSFLYGEYIAKAFMPEIERICKVYYSYKSDEMIEIEKAYDTQNRFTEEDIILITYGDLVREEGVSPLTTLSKFCGFYLNQTINTLHILPFFPYSSDKGFSIINFETVDPRLGSWENIEDLSARYKLMFDGVINHVSSKSRWFQEFLKENPHYKNFFISYKSYDELTSLERSIIFRPRTSDILTKYYTINGPKYVWSTFSKDQIDLNYRNPYVLIRVLEILLFYVRKGTDIIRLDAVTYLWANPGTSCANLEETHTIIKIFRDVLEFVAPHVAIITETNIPHNDNISYFGNGHDEAQMVYNFALPPMVLHTFYTKDSTKLSQWVKDLKPVSKLTTFFNFLDSHDGIGLMAVKDILTHEDIKSIIKKAEEHGGFISYKTDKYGIQIPYEINITWFSALNKENNGENIDFQVKKFIASRAIALVLQGVPGIYLHGFLGTKNNATAVIDAKTKREINRTVIDYNMLIRELNDPVTLMSKISHRLNSIIAIRKRQIAFHPNSIQQVLINKPEVFIVLRISEDKKQYILSLINISEKCVSVMVTMKSINIFKREWYDLINKEALVFNDKKIEITLEPYDVKWLTPQI